MKLKVHHSQTKVLFRVDIKSGGTGYKLWVPRPEINHRSSHSCKSWIYTCHSCPAYSTTTNHLYLCFGERQRLFRSYFPTPHCPRVQENGLKSGVVITTLVFVKSFGRPAVRIETKEQRHTANTETVHTLAGEIVNVEARTESPSKRSGKTFRNERLCFTVYIPLARVPPYPHPHPTQPSGL